MQPSPTTWVWSPGPPGRREPSSKVVLCPPGGHHDHGAHRTLLALFFFNKLFTAAFASQKQNWIIPTNTARSVRPHCVRSSLWWGKLTDPHRDKLKMASMISNIHPYPWVEKTVISNPWSLVIILYRIAISILIIDCPFLQHWQSQPLCCKLA